MFVLAVAGSAAMAQVTGIQDLGYRVTTFGQDAGGLTALQPGTIFVIKVPGLLGVTQMTLMTCPASMDKGVFKKSGGTCAMLVKDHSAYFQPGLKVYLQKLDVDQKHDKVSLHLVACDDCNGTYPHSFYKTGLNIQLPKGELASTPAENIKAQIAQVLEIDRGQAAPQAPQSPPAPTRMAEPMPAPIPPPPAPAPDPVSITAGQSIDDVVAALGQPLKKFKPSAIKEIYIYKDLKITFVNGKVKDVD